MTLAKVGVGRQSGFSWCQQEALAASSNVSATMLDTG